MKKLVVIPARGGSKGIPGKNIKLLKGIPLIQYTIDAAREVVADEHIMVSTDDEEIKSIVEKTGIKVPKLRPAHLARDESSTNDLLNYIVRELEGHDMIYDIIVLLQPTSPLRNSQDILNAIDVYEDQLDMVVSVKESDANPYYNLFEETSGALLTKSKPGNFTRRQDCPPVYEFNGAVYVININSIREKTYSNFDKIRKYVMPDLRSIDIDTPLDWDIAERILQRG